MRAGYAIVDEPSSSRLSHLTVQPTMPLLGLMLGGAWLAWPWFVVNALAMGSPTRRREIALVVVAFVVSIVLAGSILLALHLGLIQVGVARYAVLAVTVWKLGIAYWLHTLQSRTFGVYEHFGGRVRNGLGVLVIGFIVRAWLVTLPDFVWLVFG